MKKEYLDQFMEKQKASELKMEKLQSLLKELQKISLKEEEKKALEEDLKILIGLKNEGTPAPIISPFMILGFLIV